MGRILAIDIGQKRIGLAATDPLQIAAMPLDTIPVNNIWEFLEQYIMLNEVDAVVVGWPLTMSGEESDAMRYVKPFVKKFGAKYSEIKLVKWDERFTSFMAKKAILQSGVNKKTRSDKALVDKVSAAIMLQSYLESLQF